MSFTIQSASVPVVETHKLAMISVVAFVYVSGFGLVRDVDDMVMEFTFRFGLLL